MKQNATNQILDPLRIASLPGKVNSRSEPDQTNVAILEKIYIEFPSQGDSYTVWLTDSSQLSPFLGFPFKSLCSFQQRDLQVFALARP